ncbi:hypothetical protein PRIC1_008883 [Phytophthora ramorum]|uniref:Uncharacterized protein n=1 Tax=Phytophthora ramorum TaxID=164328 RepID=H3HE51_PHYRM|nr:hypothetical protein KRP23_6367 [Phytophthora ramorum]KAH7505262.1 hypothetical protein KRP22_5736 [Phytophthora ramorum]
MRMRLRAPDEPEAESSYDGDSVDSAPSIPEDSHSLPPLDVGSPEYIEERLENLKRRPNWGEFLDQYVQDHPDSDSESEAEDFVDVSVVDTTGFLCSTLWSLLVVSIAPLLVLCAPCLRHKEYGFWPLGCRSLKELLGVALTNVAFVAFGLVLLYWTICRELPDVFNVSNTLVKLNVQMDEVQRAANTCHAALLQWERTLAQELCMPAGIDGVLLLLNTWLLLHCHRRWARYFMVLMAVMFVVDVPAKLYDATFPAPEIYKVDPTFAMVDEELQVALDGKNLKPGGSVAWVAYWGCATTSDVDTCEKQFQSTFEAGIVPVTFKSLDHFIPCYRDPPNPLKAQEYLCFENVRIRVKDKQSIPGWSRSAPQASVNTRPTHVDHALNGEVLDYLEVPPRKPEEASLSSQINQEVVEPTRSKQRMVTSSESNELVDIDISATITTREYTLETDDRNELKNEAVGLSGEGATQDNESEVEPESTQSTILHVEKHVIGEELDVTSEAELKVPHDNVELEIATQRENVVSSQENLWQPATQTRGLQEIEVDGTVNQAIAEKVQEVVLTLDESELEFDLVEFDLVLKEYYDAKSNGFVEEVKASTVIVVDEEEEPEKPVLPSSNNDEAFEAEAKNAKEERESRDEQRTMKGSTDEPRLEEVSVSDIVEQEKQDPNLKVSTSEGVTSQPKPSDATQPTGVNMKEKPSMKQKSRRSRQAKKSLDSVVVDNVELTAATGTV